jgi:AraC-like DNA-binding protein
MLQAGLIALDRCRVFSAESVSEIQENIARVMQPHRLRALNSRSPHRGYMDYLSFPSMGIGTIHFGHMSLEVEQADFYVIIFCVRGHARIALGRSEVVLTDDVGVCFSPGDQISAEFSGDCQQLVIRLDGRMVRRFAGGQATFHRRIDLRDPSLAPWARFVRTIIADPATIDLIASNETVATAYQDVFMSTLFASSVVTDRLCTRAAQPVCVKRAEEFIQVHFREPLTLELIASAARVSPRTLLQNFRKFCNTSPVRRLRDVRLDAAHANLQSGTKDKSAVLDIALESGFTHLGRFAQQYYHRFGEKPSSTLKIGRASR